MKLLLRHRVKFGEIKAFNHAGCICVDVGVGVGVVWVRVVCCCTNNSLFASLVARLRWHDELDHLYSS